MMCLCRLLIDTQVVCGNVYIRTIIRMMFAYVSIHCSFTCTAQFATLGYIFRAIKSMEEQRTHRPLKELLGELNPLLVMTMILESPYIFFVEESYPQI